VVRFITLRRFHSFQDKIYDEWQSQAIAPEKTNAWLAQRLLNQFVSLSDPPLWIYCEPQWPFVQGRPLIFLFQCTFPKDGPLVEELVPGETVYFFAGLKYNAEKKVHTSYMKKFQYPDRCSMIDTEAAESQPQRIQSNPQSDGPQHESHGIRNGLTSIAKLSGSQASSSHR
jgi:hypothetical protein